MHSIFIWIVHVSFNTWYADFGHTAGDRRLQCSRSSILAEFGRPRINDLISCSTCPMGHVKCFGRWLGHRPWFSLLFPAGYLAIPVATVIRWRFYYALGSQVSVRSAFESAQQVLRVDPDPKAALAVPCNAGRRCSTIDGWILRMADYQSIVYHCLSLSIIVYLDSCPSKKSSIVIISQKGFWFQLLCCRWRPVLQLGEVCHCLPAGPPISGVCLNMGWGPPKWHFFYISETYDKPSWLGYFGYPGFINTSKSALDLERISFRRVQKNISAWPVWSVPPRTCLSSLANMLHALRRCLVDQCKFTSQQMAAGLQVAEVLSISLKQRSSIL